MELIPETWIMSFPERVKFRIRGNIHQKMIRVTLNTSAEAMAKGRPGFGSPLIACEVSRLHQ